ncbi:hypothetical protein MRX96_006999 [Rhipicephalus microplus]
MGLRRSEVAPTRRLLLRRGFRVPYYRPEAGIHAKRSQPAQDSVSMEHSTTVMPSSNKKGSSSATENAAGRRAAVTTPETHTVGLTCDPAFTCCPSGQQNDILTGERMEDYATSNCPADHINDGDSGVCWKTITKKRRTRKMNTYKETELSEGIPGVSQHKVRKQSGNHHLPRLPIHD